MTLLATEERFAPNDETISDECEDDQEFGRAYTNIKLINSKYEGLTKALSLNEMQSRLKVNYSDASEVCKHLGKQSWAYVTFELAKDTAMKIVQDVRVRFPDKVAVVGNKWLLLQWYLF